jgi:hypothetical protein
MLGRTTITQTMDTYSHVLPDAQDHAVVAMGRVSSQPDDLSSALPGFLDGDHQLSFQAFMS